MPAAEISSQHCCLTPVQAWLEGQAGEAATGKVPGEKTARLGRTELRSAVAVARKSCGELRSKTVFYQVGRPGLGRAVPLFLRSSAARDSAWRVAQGVWSCCVVRTEYPGGSDSQKAQCGQKVEKFEEKGRRKTMNQRKKWSQQCRWALNPALHPPHTKAHGAQRFPHHHLLLLAARLRGETQSRITPFHFSVLLFDLVPCVETVFVHASGSQRQYTMAMERLVHRLSRVTVWSRSGHCWRCA